MRHLDCFEHLLKQAQDLKNKGGLNPSGQSAPNAFNFKSEDAALLLLGATVALLAYVGSMLLRLARAEEVEFRKAGLPLAESVGLFSAQTKNEDLEEARLTEERNNKKILMGEISSQVAHDIRSPLAALNMIIRDASGISTEDRKILLHATQRINDIANLLLQAEEGNFSDRWSRFSRSLPMMVADTLDLVISEKRAEFRDKTGLQIIGSLEAGHGLFCEVDPVELSRVISNLVNNSVEAIEGPGLIEVKLRSNGKSAIIEVTDTGKGMTAEVLKNASREGFSYGKQGCNSGFGIGLSHAKKFSEYNGGQLSITSKVAGGTRVSLSLPMVSSPKRLVEALKLTKVAAS